MAVLRVLHLYAGQIYGGVEKLLVTLAAERAKCPAMDPHFALCWEGRLSAELAAAGVPVHKLGAVRYTRPWTVWRARHALKRLLGAKPGYDVVMTHSCWLHAVFAPAVREFDTRLVFWSHDAYAEMKPVDLRAARTVPDQVLVNSEFTSATLPMLFPTIPAEVIHYPIAPPPPMDRDAVRAEVRSAMGVDANTCVIFMAARLEPWKGHAHLLNALAHLAETPGWVAWLGGGPQRPHEQAMFDALHAQAVKLKLGDKVKFIGQRSDVPKLLCAADIHCQPNSGPEPFGIVFIEALQAGLPVVTTRIGAAPEIIDDTCGRLAPAGDAVALAGILNDLVANPANRSRLAGGGPTRAHALCGVSAQLNKLRQLLSASTPA